MPAGYANAQLDDHRRLSRSSFPWHPPVNLKLRARASGASPLGTLGFGFWNDPFSLTFGQAGAARKLPVPPRAVWFFYGSPPNDMTALSAESGLGMESPELGSARHSRLVAGGPRPSRLSGRQTASPSSACDAGSFACHRLRRAHPGGKPRCVAYLRNQVAYRRRHVLGRWRVDAGEPNFTNRPTRICDMDRQPIRRSHLPTGGLRFGVIPTKNRAEVSTCRTWNSRTTQRLEQHGWPSSTLLMDRSPKETDHAAQKPGMDRP